MTKMASCLAFENWSLSIICLLVLDIWNFILILGKIETMYEWRTGRTCQKKLF
jgi:hypothetical protein